MKINTYSHFRNQVVVSVGGSGANLALGVGIFAAIGWKTHIMNTNEFFIFTY